MGSAQRYGMVISLQGDTIVATSFEDVHCRGSSLNTTHMALGCNPDTSILGYSSTFWTKGAMPRHRANATTSTKNEATSTKNEAASTKNAIPHHSVPLKQPIKS